MADALRSGRSGRKAVEVQVLSRAPEFKKLYLVDIEGLRFRVGRISLTFLGFYFRLP